MLLVCLPWCYYYRVICGHVHQMCNDNKVENDMYLVLVKQFLYNNKAKI